MTPPRQTTAQARVLDFVCRRTALDIDGNHLVEVGSPRTRGHDRVVSNQDRRQAGPAQNANQRCFGRRFRSSPTRPERCQAEILPLEVGRMGERLIEHKAVGSQAVEI